MNLVLDTGGYSEFVRGQKRLLKWINSNNTIFVPQIVIGELRAGFAVGTKKAENESLLQRFLDSPNVNTISLTDKTTEIYSEIYLDLRKRGKPTGTNDMWIAACAIEHGYTLLTLDKAFKNITSLKLNDL